MYPVTANYKEQMDRTLRNPSHVRIVFGVTDPDTPAASTPGDSGHLLYSDINSVDIGLSVASPYQTLEKNRFILDGRSPLAPEKDFLYQGFVSTAISDGNGVFATPPVVQITFSDYFQFAALTLYFDTIMNEYASEFRVQCYYDGTAVMNTVYNPTGTEFVTPDQIPVCNKIILTFTKTFRPHRRLRLSQIIYGVISSLTASDIKECQQTASIDIVSSSLPYEMFSFTIMDVQQRYDPENPQGVWEYLESRQPVNVSIGYELDDESIEWFPWCNTYSTGNVKVQHGGVVTEVTIETESLIQQLTKTFTHGVYRANGATLADLAEEVMVFAGYPNILNVDASLKNMKTMMPLPDVSIAQCLQLIANAAMCVLITDRSGSPAIIKISEDDPVEDFEMNFKVMKDKPVTSKYPILRNFITDYKHVLVDSSVSSLVADAVVTDANKTAIEFAYQTATNQTVSVSSGLTLVSATHYATRSILVLSGSGTVSISGNTIETQAVGYTKIVHEVGEDLEMTNELITSYAHAKQYADWVANCMERRIEYTVEDRGFPEIDLGDTLDFVTNFGNVIPVNVMKKTLKFNGAISGSGTYLARR